MPTTPGPLLARFVPNCANWLVGSVHWALPTAHPRRSVQILNLRSQSPLCRSHPFLLCRSHYEVIDPPATGEVIDPPCGRSPLWVCLVLPGPSFCSAHLAPPNFPLYSWPQIVWTNFCVLHSAYCTVVPPNWTKSKGRSPNSFSLFLTLGPLHRWPCVGGGPQSRALCVGGPGQLALTSGRWRLGLPTALSPLHKGRAKRGRTGGWDAREACGPAERPPLWARALKKKAQAQRAQAFVVIY